MGLVFWLPGVALVIVGYVWLVLIAFRVHILWGLFGFCFWPLLVVFAIVHWDKARQAAGVWFLGWVLMLIGEVLSPRLSRKFRARAAVGTSQSV